MAESLDIGGGNIFGFLNMFTGGALGRFTIFAMGVNPYITASIILQLLTIVIPQLEELAKEGIEGRKKIQQYTRYGTVLLGLVQAYGITVLARNSNVITNPTFFSLLLIVITLTAGTSFLMWLGEKISENGIGNGISMIIFAGIVAEFPIGIIQAVQNVGEGGISIFSLLVLAVLFVVIIGAVVLVQEGQRRIPVQYAKRVVGRRMYGGQSTHIPLRVNNAGVIPVIFASSVLTFPLTLAQFVPAIAPTVGSLVRHWFGGLCGGLRFARHLLYVLLHGGHIQPGGSRQQHAEKRRLHSRIAAGTPHLGISRSNSDEAYLGRSDLPRRDRDPPLSHVGDHADAVDIPLFWRH